MAETRPPIGHLRQRQRIRPPSEPQRRAGDANLLLRPLFPLAARHHRKHQRPPPPRHAPKNQPSRLHRPRHRRPHLGHQLNTQKIPRLQLALEAAINRLDRFHLLILDDLAYVSKDQAETSVLFELISARYERRSVLITANQPFGEWGKIFPDPAMTLAVVDRLVHHATIFEMNVDSYRRRTALDRKRGPGRPPSRATPNTAPTD